MADVALDSVLGPSIRRPDFAFVDADAIILADEDFPGQGVCHVALYRATPSMVRQHPVTGSIGLRMRQIMSDSGSFERIDMRWERPKHCQLCGRHH
jgi:hypothetical protein